MTLVKHSSFRLAAGFAATALVLAACGKAEAPPEPIRAVKVLTVGATAFQSSYEFSGEVRPRIESKLGFRVAGKITRRNVELGQHVSAGTVLAQLDAQDFRLAAAAARAQVAAAETQRDLAAADYKRYLTLREQNFISGAELERRDTTLKAAQAQLDQAHAQLASQGNQAGYANLVADVSGVITSIDAEPGQVVAAGTPVVRIAEDGPRDVVFSVPEDKVGTIKPGSDASVRLWAGNGELKGAIREVAASADPVTRTYQVKLALDASARPPLGATVTVLPQALSHAGQPVIKLPTSALRQEGKATAVWVLDRATMTVKSQPVVVATADGNDAVIAAGLSPGMQVVSAGVHVLSPGQKVTIWVPASVRPDAAEGVAARAPASLVGTAEAATLPATK
ncbi:MAG TPA: efflux RND transporter periplasmic adaptor subunit [Ramlibacter sp.]|uniref:efflux RND transporter periplasmic adaptor subunit n=1 Tax=Ramlibacter sp. TaxID=1917967 RepID=UPI002C557180|nr:efflux RND transporter periplasmic adaptor subunit [Ramlibacter sp.]HVZ43463.1 efflux RND transporter periplasmic adaptor subunit [Ramlibacter sp.]